MLVSALFAAASKRDFELQHLSEDSSHLLLRKDAADPGIPDESDAAAAAAAIGNVTRAKAKAIGHLSLRESSSKEGHFFACHLQDWVSLKCT